MSMTRTIAFEFAVTIMVGKFGKKEPTATGVASAKIFRHSPVATCPESLPKTSIDQTTYASTFDRTVVIYGFVFKNDKLKDL